MGCIISTVEKMEYLIFKDLKSGQVVKADAVVRVGEDEILIRLANGNFVTTGRRGRDLARFAITDFGRENRSKAILDALVKIGAATSEEVAQHVKATEEWATVQERKRRETYLAELCAQLGVPNPLATP